MFILLNMVLDFIIHATVYDTVIAP